MDLAYQVVAVPLCFSETESHVTSFKSQVTVAQTSLELLILLLLPPKFWVSISCGSAATRWNECLGPSLVPNPSRLGFVEVGLVEPFDKPVVGHKLERRYLECLCFLG